MNINWKQLATTPGYKSLKAAYIKDVQDIQRHKYPMRKKEELLAKFNWVIGRAMYYAHRNGRPIGNILWSWESDRNYWWLNYYQDSNQPKKKSVS